MLQLVNECRCSLCDPWAPSDSFSPRTHNPLTHNFWHHDLKRWCVVMCSLSSSTVGWPIPSLRPPRLRRPPDNSTRCHRHHLLHPLHRCSTSDDDSTGRLAVLRFLISWTQTSHCLIRPSRNVCRTQISLVSSILSRMRLD